MTAVSSAATQQNSKVNEYKKPQDTKKSSGSASAAAAKTPKTSVFTRQQEAKAKADTENKALGLINTKGAGTKIKSKNGKEYTVVGNASNGRKIVKDSNGQTQVLAQDGTLLNKAYVKGSVQKANQAAAAKKNKELAELKSLGLTNTNGAGTKVKSKNGNEYIVIGNASNGRKIVKDSNGQTQVLAQDGTLLKKDYVQRNVKSQAVATDSKSAQQAALETMNTQLKTAQKAFQQQLDQDGWAADVADGISNIWGWIGENGNQAWRVRRDLQTYTQNMQELQKAAKQGDAAFNQKFKQIYGKDFDQKAMAEYTKNPTTANYQKAFGTKNNIKTRVDNYNSSQQTGAEAVKTTAKIGAGVAIGIATGGTGFVALGATAVATGAASLVIDETDRLKVTDIATKGEVKFREGTDHKKILTSAAFDGASVFAGGIIGKAAIGVTKGATTFGAKAVRLAMNTTGDVVVGAAQEYVETGTVTAGGVISNAAMSAIGGTVVDGTLQGLGKGLSYVKGKIKGGNIDIDIDTKKLADAASDIDLPATGRVQTDVDVDLPSVHTNPDIDVNPKVSADVDIQTSGVKSGTDVDLPAAAHTNADVDVPATRTAADDVTQRINGADNGTSAAKKKTYIAPETKQVDITLKDDIMAGSRVTNTDISTGTSTVGNSAVSGSHQTVGTTPAVKKGFIHEIMSNTNTAEAGLRSCDLSDAAARQTYIDALSAEFPDFARYPKKQKLLNQMQQLLNHPDYANLSDANKTMAKLSILKNNGIEPSDLYKSCKTPVSIKRRISDIEYCVQNSVDPKSAAILYHDGDFATFKVLSDITSSNPVDFSGLQSVAARSAENGGYMIQQSHITNPKNIPTAGITKNGTTYNVKVLDLSDDKVISNLSDYGFDTGTTKDNLKLTVHMNDDINRAPQMTVRRMQNSTDLNLSATLTDGTNHLYGDMQVGILLDYDQGAVSYASNYAAGTGFVKNKTGFAADKLKESASSADSFIKDRFLANLKENGIEMSSADYAAFSNMTKGKKMTSAQFQSMTQDGLITINGKKYNAKQIQSALEQSSNDMLNMQAEINGKKFKKGFNEINVYNPEIKALYIRGNNPDDKLEDILSDKLLKYAQDNNLPIVFQRSNYS